MSATRAVVCISSASVSRSFTGRTVRDGISSTCVPYIGICRFFPLSRGGGSFLKPTEKTDDPSVCVVSV